MAASERTTMKAVELSWDECRAVIDVLCAKALPYMLEDADHIQRLLEQHGPVESTVRLNLTDDVYLRSSNWALAAGHPLAARSRRFSPVS
jgi:hypothetical protein